MSSHVGEQHRDVRLPAQHPPDRRRDVARRQRRRRDLIQQRLEQMVVVAIEQRDAHRRAGERPRRVEAAEAAADDDDVGAYRSRFSVLGSQFVFTFGSGVRRSWFGSCVRCYRDCHGSRLIARAQRPARRTGIGRRHRVPARLSGCLQAVGHGAARQGGRDRRLAQEPGHRRVHLREGPEVRRARLRPRPPAPPGACGKGRKGEGTIRARVLGRGARAHRRADGARQGGSTAARRSCPTRTADRTG